MNKGKHTKSIIIIIINVSRLVTSSDPPNYECDQTSDEVH